MPVADRRSKDAIYEQLARIGKAVAAPKRLELLDLLAQGPRTVEALAEQAGLSVANASQHLRVLRGARLVEASKHGQFVEYRLADEAVAQMFVTLRELARSRLAEVELAAREYLGDRESMEPLPLDALLQRMREGEVTVLDVRPAEEFRAGHLPGALSIPVAELPARLAELPKGRDVVAYCRGPYCVMAIDAVEQLRAAGFVAHRLEHGVTELRAEGIELARVFGGRGASS